MKLLGFLTAILILFGLTASFAGPTTNLEEYKGDKKLTKQQQEEFQTKLDQGLQYFDKGQYDLAEKEFTGILAFAPKKNLAYFNLGLVKYKQGDYAAAIKNFDQVIKKRSYYVGAAFYYKAICQNNLDQKEAALKTAKRFTPARFFFKPNQGLVTAIESGSDEFLENAKAAFTDDNYELCLVEMEESVLADTSKGKALTEQCRAAALAEQAPPAVPQKAVVATRPTFWLDTRISHSDNVYQESSNILGKYLYSLTLGAEYTVKSTVDYGLGVTYDYSNAIDLTYFKDEIYNVYIPVYYRNDRHRYAAEVFYNQSKNNDTNAYAEAGAYLSYFYTGDNYLLGAMGNASNKNSLNTAFDYRTGSYTGVRLLASRYIGALTLGANLGYEENLSGDVVFGPALLPFADKVLRAGVSAAYDVTTNGKLTLRATNSNLDYLNVVSANGTDRKDTNANYSLQYQHTFNKNVKAYLQQAYVKNDSNYDNSEILNKNYTENITSLGLSLVSF